MATNQHHRLLLLLVILAAVSRHAMSVTTETINAAALTLGNSGRLSMSMTLQLFTDNSSVLEDASSLTVFAPSDAAFSRSGQPSLSLVLYHCSPVPYPLPSLNSLPVGSKIPTLDPSHTLVITSNANSLKGDTFPSLNGIKISQDPIFSNGSLLILGVDEFFDPGFKASAPGARPNVCGLDVSSSGYYSIAGAMKVLRSNGYGIVASFLDSQLPVTFEQGTSLTIFAPADWAAKDNNRKTYASLILKYIVRCKYHWRDLVDLADGVVLETLAEGFHINLMNASGGKDILVNGIRVSHPNLYSSEWLVVHGLDGQFADNPRVANGAAGISDRFLLGAGDLLVYVISSLFLYLF